MAHHQTTIMKIDIDADNELILPDDLRARLEAAGVTNESGLREALERDPSLRADLEKVLRDNPDAANALAMHDVFDQFAAAQTTAELREFWENLPDELAEPLMQTIEELLQDPPPDADPVFMQALRDKHSDLLRFQSLDKRIQELPPVERAAVEFAQVADEADAREMFAEQRELFQLPAARRVLEMLVSDMPADMPAELKQHIITRLALFDELRKG